MSPLPPQAEDASNERHVRVAYRCFEWYIESTPKFGAIAVKYNIGFTFPVRRGSNPLRAKRIKISRRRHDVK